MCWGGGRAHGVLGPDPTSAGSTNCYSLRDSASRFTSYGTLKSAKVEGLGKEKASLHSLRAGWLLTGFPADLGVGQTEADRVGSEGGSH